VKLVVFGLSVSSAWGNGHATLWRGLIRALGRRGHDVVFFERDAPWYAASRDLHRVEGGTLILYDDWAQILPRMRAELCECDVAMTTSYCPDAIAARDLAADLGVPRLVYYDLDAPVTLARVAAGERVAYVEGGLARYDLVLSYTGGPALTALRDRLGARRTAPLYGSVDPVMHAPAAPPGCDGFDLSYLGTYAADRQSALVELLIEPARRAPARKFLIAGAQYPTEFPWTGNIFFRRHVPPPDHPRFYAAARLTLNVTREAMARDGWCPSGRLFEAAACGVPILSDAWPGLDAFFAPGDEILVARSGDDTLDALALDDAALAAMARRARERVLDQHTAEHRARELEMLLEPATEAATEAFACGA
jgi:spore maturation protein CgeB